MDTVNTRAESGDLSPWDIFTEDAATEAIRAARPAYRKRRQSCPPGPKRKEGTLLDGALTGGDGLSIALTGLSRFVGLDFPRFRFAPPWAITHRPNSCAIWREHII